MNHTRLLNILSLIDMVKVHFYIDGKFSKEIEFPMLPRIGDWVKFGDKVLRVESVQFMIDSPKKGFNFVEIFLTKINKNE